MRLASGPVSWGVDFAGAPDAPPWAEVLDGIAAAGYGGTELGPYGYLPAARAPLAERGLLLCGGFIFEPLHDPAESARILQLARDVATRVQALGGSYLLIIDSVSESRSATAGRTGDAARLRPAARDAMGETIARIARAVRALGVTPLIHPHAGTYIEFADEIAALEGICGLCLDTGHSAYAGIDPVAFYAAAPERIGCLHLKDLDPARVKPTFWASVAAGAFVPLGRGSVDIAGTVRAAQREGYQGWLVVEQDRASGTGDPVADLRASRAYLGELIT